jgi:hypothetical protein
VNQRIYVLNEALQPQPAGFCGEIYVAGAGVSKGYVNLPDRTAKVSFFYFTMGVLLHAGLLKGPLCYVLRVLCC